MGEENKLHGRSIRQEFYKDATDEDCTTSGGWDRQIYLQGHRQDQQNGTVVKSWVAMQCRTGP